MVARRVQVRYTPDWRPIEFTFDGNVRGQPQRIHTVVEGTTAKSDIAINGKTTQKTDTIDGTALLLAPSSFFAPYEALAVRVRGAAAGAEIPAYAEGAMTPFTIKIGDSFDEQIQTTSRLVRTRRTHLIMQMPAIALDADLWIDDQGRLIRFSIPAQTLDVVREDIAAVSSRTVTISRPNDEKISIPSNGFNLAGTLSQPAQSAAAKQPAVVLVGGSGPTDRDGLAFGVPILGEVAGALAEAGFIVVRYDKRGIGQSGGRAEAATLNDYADDARAAVKLLARSQGRRSEAHRGRRPQRRRTGRIDCRGQGQTRFRGRARFNAGHVWNRRGACAAAAASRPHEARRRRNGRRRSTRRSRSIRP